MSSDYFKFINSGSTNSENNDVPNKIHYWEPHTSSIDFCETNYLHSSYIVEPHNVVSSLWGLAAIGITGIYYGNPTNELRYKIAYVILILIGLGSAALHATLHWIFQSSDELPMIYLILSAVYCCLELEDKTLKYPWLPHVFVAVGIINTLVYFYFQQMYIVFLLTFIGMTIVGLILHLQIAWKQRKILTSKGEANGTSHCPAINSKLKPDEKLSTIHRNNARIALKFYIWHYIVFIFIAAPVWTLDQFWCTNFIDVYDTMLKGCTLHVIWHLMAGLGAHTILQFLVVCRMSVLGLSCTIRWILGIVPVVVLNTTFEHKEK